MVKEVRIIQAENPDRKEIFKSIANEYMKTKLNDTELDQYYQILGKYL